LRFQYLELPRPIRTGTSKAFAVAVGFFLASGQVAMQEVLIVAIKGFLRAVPRTTRQPAGKNQEGNAKN
jgi:hypothetical protein